MPTRRIAVVILALALSSTAHAASSKLKLVKDGKTVQLPNVIATRFVPNKGAARLFLLFTDVKATGVELADPFGEAMLTISRWIDGTKAHAVEVSFDEGDEKNYSLNVYGDGMMSGGGGHRSGGDVSGVFKKLSVAERKVSGEVQADEQSGALSGTFDVEPLVVHEAPIVTGPAVAKSPQGIALLGFTRAMKKADFKAAQPFAARDLKVQFEEAKKMLGEKDARAMLAEMIGDPKKLEKQLQTSGASLLESGDQARIRVSETLSDATGHGSTTQTYSLRKVAGQWKVD